MHKLKEERERNDISDFYRGSNPYSTLQDSSSVFYCTYSLTSENQTDLSPFLQVQESNHFWSFCRFKIQPISILFNGFKIKPLQNPFSSLSSGLNHYTQIQGHTLSQIPKFPSELMKLKEKKKKNSQNVN